MPATSPTSFPTNASPASKARHGFVGWRLRVGVALAVSVFGACEGVSKTAEDERRIAAEQVIIEAYSDRVPDVDAKLKTFLAAWERANEKKDIKSLKDDMVANVQPAFAAHIAALEAMPAGSEALAAIHRPLVATYKSAQQAFDVFLRDVTEDNLDVEYTKLLGAMDAVKVAEDAYFRSLEAHYVAHRLTLKKVP